MQLVKRLFLSVFSVLAIATVSHLYAATTYIVDPAGTYKTINAAYTVAASSGDTILLTAGYTYTGSGNVNLTFAKNLTLGRTGSGTDPVIDMKNTAGTRFCTVSASYTISMTNLCIKNGYASTGGDESGGAIKLSGTLYTYSCTFSHNNATGYAGAIYVISSTGVLKAYNTTFNNNTATLFGGALLIFYSTYLENCIFNANTAASDGGAIWFNSGVLLSIKNCTFENNSAVNGGAIRNYNNIAVAGCTFFKNSATSVGGAVYQAGAATTISCSRFINNTATGNGKTIYNSGTLTATNNWWGSNNPSFASLIYNAGTVTYTPWIVINILPALLQPKVGMNNLITADFTKNSNGTACGCTNFFSGQVKFSTTSGTLTPTTKVLTNLQATTTLSGLASSGAFTLCVYTDTDLTKTYQYCRTGTALSIGSAYVSSISGNDSNDGSAVYPVSTIQRGIDIATSSGLTGTVYLEAGNTFAGTGNKDLAVTASVNITRYGTATTDPIIDMQSSMRFCTINSGKTLQLNHLVIQNGSADYGGAIANHGIFSATACTFSNNRATVSGGALYNYITSGSVAIHCCRIVHNTAATAGNAICNANDFVAVSAANNWWGSNTIEPSSLFFGSVVYDPWIITNLLPSSLQVQALDKILITADFTKNSTGQSCGCNPYFSGKVKFSATSGSLTATINSLTDGKATTTLSSFTSSAPFTLCEYTDADLSTTYAYCRTGTVLGVGQIYISANSGNDLNTGSVLQPVRTIQRGINIATSWGITCTLYLEAGNTFTGTGNKDLTVTRNISLDRYGAATANPIIDMQSSKRFCAINAGYTVSMSNLCIKNGYASTSGDISGGAIKLSGTLYTYSCTFSNNSATGYAGAIYVISSTGVLKAYNTTFNNNTATSSGGAILTLNSTYLENCIFNTNTSVADGGAIWFNSSMLLSIKSCTFSNNRAVNGGAIRNYIAMTVTGCTFKNNRSTTDGGVIYGVSTDISGCTFSNNSAGGKGGAAFLTATSTISCSRFINNTATTSGNAIYNSAGTPTLTNNWWGSNSPSFASLIYNAGSSTYTPWIVIDFLPDPLQAKIGINNLITADFTKNSNGAACGCTNFFSGQVKFSTTSGTLTPTTKALTNLQATTTLSGLISSGPFTLCIYTDTDLTKTYQYCKTGTSLRICSAYVSSVSGNNANDGSQMYPVKTIARGIELLASCLTTGTLYLEACSTFIGTGNRDLAITTSINITRYGAGANPIIDIENSPGKRFCTINPGITVSLSNLDIRNGNASDYGGAVYVNHSNLNMVGCTCSKNHADLGGGALYNYEGICSINCNRFINNTATNGNAMYNAYAVVDATYNWWGTNNPDLIENSLFYNDESMLTYNPWIVINLLPEPLIPSITNSTIVTADFTHDNREQTCNCSQYFNGFVKFSTTDGSLTSTLSSLVNGQATTTLFNLANRGPITVCTYTDADLTTTYAYCKTGTVQGNYHIYISAQSGNDSNDGSLAYPIKTIARGVELSLDCISTCTFYLEAGNSFIGTGNKDLTITKNVAIARYGNATADPIIDMQSSGRFCTINSGKTVQLQHLVIQNGYADYGGAIANHGIFSAAACSFDSNRATSLGGALYNYSQSGSVSILCNRFVHNTAAIAGNAICNANDAIVVSAANNWWGNNAIAPSSLFSGNVFYDPWIIINLLPDPFQVQALDNTLITADFTKNSIGQSCGCSSYFSGKVKFSTTSGSLTTTINSLTDGKATTTLSGLTSSDPFTLCAYTDADLSTTYAYCKTGTIIDFGHIYVSADSGDDGNKGSLEYPVKTITRGIALLADYAITGTLYLQAGNTFTGGSNKNLTITKSIHIDRYGAGANPIIDMASSGNFCIVNGNKIVSMSNLYIRNGSIGSGEGGAIKVYGELYLYNCTLSGNYANGGGGAVSVPGMLIAYNTTFNNNSGYNGGAILSNSYIYLNGCIFNSNFSSDSMGYGGAVYAGPNTTSYITNSIFKNGNGKNGGGAIMSYAPISVTGCTFYKNQASYGGAIYSYGQYSSISCSRFINNTATSFGNAIYNYSGTTYATNNWWGSNSPIFGSLVTVRAGAVTSDPWIIIKLLPDSLQAKIADNRLIAADFTRNINGSTCGCTNFFSGQVYFSSTKGGVLTPTINSLVDGQTTTTLTGFTGTDPFILCVYTDTDLTATYATYAYCKTGTVLPASFSYISTLSGDDSNDGSLAHPVKTIARGLALVSTGTLYLEAGNTFTGAGNKDLTITLSNLSIRPYTGSHGTADPIINMEGDKRFCTINSGIHVTMSNLVIQNGNVVSDIGGGIYNKGILNIRSCIFSNNSATGGTGGAIANEGLAAGDGILNATNCTFSNNSADLGGAIWQAGATTDSGVLNATNCIFNGNTAAVGGVLYNGYITTAGTSAIECCRFIDNTATTSADAIYNFAGTVTATHCWWGTKHPGAADLFGGTAVTYEPYIVINLLPDPLLIKMSSLGVITADFTKNNDGSTSSCTIMNGMPVIFSSAANITISPTSNIVVDGQATTTIFDSSVTYSFLFCAKTDTDLSTTGYSYCETATPYLVTEIYVSALHGNDSNSGTSTSDPVRTIAHGIGQLSHVAAVASYLYLEAGNTFTGTGNKDLTITLSNLAITKYTGIHGTANPIINMQGNKRFCVIDSGITVTMSNLVIQNGEIDNGNGGAIQNNGIISIINCIFSNNNVTGDEYAGGAIANAGTLNATGCTFSNNAATYGGAIANTGTVVATGSRFVGNGATYGSAIYNELFGTTTTACNELLGTVTATNCWWGTNDPSAIASSLFYGVVDYDLWIRMALSVVQPSECVADLTVTFSPSCIPDGTPVNFSTSGGYIVPTAGTTLNSTVTAEAYGFYGMQTVCAIAEPDSSAPVTLCATVQGSQNQPRPPADVQAKQQIHRFPCCADIVNTITWQKAAAQELTPVAAYYEIYAAPDSTIPAATINADAPLRFVAHQNEQGVSYVYYLYAVEAQGTCSDPVKVTLP